MELNDAVSYNAILEVKKASMPETSTIIVALKSKKIMVIALIPNNIDNKFFLLR